MMRWLLLSLALLLSLWARPQMLRLPVDSLVDRPDDRRPVIVMDAWGEQSANTVYNELLLGFLRGGELDRELRTRTRNATRANNSLGYDLGARVQWVGKDSLFGKAGLRPMLSVGHRDVLGARFTKDAFSLTFFGNAEYEGIMADLSGSGHLGMRYQTLGFGVSSGDRRSYVQVQVVNGQSMSATYIPTAEIFTGIDGRVIEADLDGRYWNSDTAGSGFGMSKGLGLALSGRWSTMALSGELPVEIGVGVQDLGFVMWDDRSVRLSRDTTINFEGITVEDIFDLDGVLSDGEQLLDTFGLRYRTGSFRTVLPFRLELNMDFTLGNGWYTGFLVQQVNVAGYAPQFTAYGAKRMGQRTLLGAELTFGGFGGVRLGSRVRHRFGERFWGTLGCSHLPALVMGRTRGFGLQVGAAFAF